MNSNEKFLIDSNSFIAPFKLYYPFDLLPKFWEQLKSEMVEGNIVLLDMVKEELQKGDDELSIWVKDINKDIILSHKDISIINNYAAVLNHIQTCGFYKAKALSDWSKESVADPWLIAAAVTYGYTIITFETKSGNLDARAQCGRAKIPDVSRKFGVKCENLFYLMRQLSFKL